MEDKGAPNRIPGRKDPHERMVEAEEQGERIVNAALAQDVKKEREEAQGMTDAEIEALTNKFLADHGSRDLVDVE